MGLALLLILAGAGSGLAASAFDPVFGEGGVVQTPLPSAERQWFSQAGKGPLIEDLALGGNGQMVAALGSGTETPYFGAARFHANGALDRRFGGAGFAGLEDAFPRFVGEAEIEAVDLQADGKVVLAGYRRYSFAQHTSALVVRLRRNGELDRSFGPRGLVSPRSGGAAFHDVAVQPGGRIVAVGGRHERGGGRPATLVAGYKPNGRLDRSFGDNGRVLFVNRREGPSYTGLRGIVILPGGKMLVVGYRNSQPFLARLKANGKLDGSFGNGDGKVLVGLQNAFCCPLLASVVALEGGGAIVLAKVWGGVVLLRLGPDGSLDRSFGRRGVSYNGIARKLEEPRGLAVQGNGRIVVVGLAARTGASDRRTKLIFAVARSLPNGKPDRHFGHGGIELLPAGYNSIGTSALALPGGHVVVGGGTQLLHDRDFEYALLMARLR